MFKQQQSIDDSVRSQSSIVIVTHINNPILFFCRTENDMKRYEQLKAIIHKHVEMDFENTGDGFLDLIKRNRGILIYSDIHNEWCRARLISIKADRNHKPICAKVLLIDFGSIEFISWKPNISIMSSTDEINNFNNSIGLCFPCSLNNIKPFIDDDDIGRAENLSSLKSEWTSYANFMFKRETINMRRFLLKKISIENSKNILFNYDQIVVCDLLPFSNNTNTNANNIKYKSMSQFLVESKVALYVEPII